jgi:hypothetical protein
MPKTLARDHDKIAVKNTTNRPQKLISKVTGDTITIMPRKTTHVHAHFATSLPPRAVRRIG